jgi:hypothetical protein
VSNVLQRAEHRSRNSGVFCWTFREFDRSSDRRRTPGTVVWEEVNSYTMRKLFALSMIALVALTLALAAYGCGKKEEAAPAATEQTMSSDSSAMSADTAMSGGAMMDSTQQAK